jgi:hypothetical protein
MPISNPLLTALLEAIVDHLDIPRSYYQRAVDRHRSLGEWLCRPESKVISFEPDVSPHGSFRYGTVNRPLVAGAEYDLDNVAALTMAKTALTQKQIKELYGAEVKGYAKANGMLAPVEEKNRCWRLLYCDEVSFHLDTLPCVPEERPVIQAIVSRGVPPEQAALAIAITDRRHPQYEVITSAFLSSNPGGFAKWFESRARASAEVRLRQLVEKRLYASVEAVPPYDWKTPLQRAIQILKRHRDVMFKGDPSGGPISMIITNLAAHAYAGEADLWSAVSNVVERMSQYVRPTRPRVPNPADPAEDYADKWAKNPQLESNFWAWHTQAKVDLAGLPMLLSSPNLASEIRAKFGVELTRDELERLQLQEASIGPALVVSAPIVRVPNAPRPWGGGN